MTIVSAKELENDKRQLHEALEEMRAHACDPQRVYSCLVQVFDILTATVAASKAHAEALLNSVLSQASNVKFLREVMVLHMDQEEIQWYLCRFLTLACNSSLRFQCQAGQLALWSDVFQVRSTHPGSMQVLETSLQTYEALLNSNEFHLFKARPTQKLVQEMLATIDQFSHPKSAQKSRSCEELRPKMVIGAMRVLATIYSSPRLQSLVEENDTKFADAIIVRLVSTFRPIFLDAELEDVRLWLRICRMQIQQHRAVAIPGLFLSGISSKPWFVLLLEKWSDSAVIMYDFLGLFTHAFALPHELGEHLNALAREVLERHNLVGSFCELLARYHDKLTRHTAGDSNTTALALLEIVRVLRQWSANETTLKCFVSRSQVKSSLIPALIARLQTTSVGLIQATSFSSKNHQQALQLTLEVLILLQKLFQLSTSIKNALTSSKELQTTVRQLKKAATTTDQSDLRRDTDLDSLVKRELTKLAQLLVTPPSQQQNSTAKKKITGSQQQSSRSLLLRKQSSRLSPTRISTRQMSSSSSASALTLRASFFATKL